MSTPHFEVEADGTLLQRVATEPPPSTGLMMSLATVQGRESKAEVLARAEQRLSQHIARYGIDESTYKMLAFYEARYNLAPGQEGSIATEQRCLNREGDSSACRMPVDHKGLCDWQVSR